MKSCAEYFTKSIAAYLQTSDQRQAQSVVSNFFIAYHSASPEEKADMKTIWAQAGLGGFPDSSFT